MALVYQVCSYAKFRNAWAIYLLSKRIPHVSDPHLYAYMYTLLIKHVKIAEKRLLEGDLSYRERRDLNVASLVTKYVQVTEGDREIRGALGTFEWLDFQSQEYELIFLDGRRAQVSGSDLDMGIRWENGKEKKALKELTEPEKQEGARPECDVAEAPGGIVS